MREAAHTLPNPVHKESAETWVAACLLSDESHLMPCNRRVPAVFPKKDEKSLQVLVAGAKTKLQTLLKLELAQ